jgi:uncharacterized protein YndB with AHSA1/START domain
LTGVAPGRATLRLTAERLIPAPPVRIWEACTTRAGLARWWAPEDLIVEVTKLEVRPEGAIDFFFRYAPALLTPESREAYRAAGVPISFHLRGRFTEVRPNVRLAFSQSLDLGRAGASPRMATEFDLRPEGGATRVVLTAEGPAEAHWQTLGAANLRGQLERMERALG